MLATKKIQRNPKKSGPERWVGLVLGHNLNMYIFEHSKPKADVRNWLYRQKCH